MVLPSRLTVIYIALLVFAVALLAQAAKLQIIEGERWTEKARALHFDNDTVAAPRGPILDASGNVLVDSHELVHLDIAPKEIRDRQKVASLLRAAHVAPALVQRAIDPQVKWVSLPDLYVASDVAELTAAHRAFTRRP